MSMIGDCCHRRNRREGRSGNGRKVYGTSEACWRCRSSHVGFDIGANAAAGRLSQPRADDSNASKNASKGQPVVLTEEVEACACIDWGCMRTA